VIAIFKNLKTIKMNQHVLEPSILTAANKSGIFVNLNKLYIKDKIVNIEVIDLIIDMLGNTKIADLRLKVAGPFNDQ
jgi:hypothetical protein